jgi:Tfp pilus assembly protein PilW
MGNYIEPSGTRRNATGNLFLESITDFTNVSDSKMVQSNCISISFINKGSNTVNVNNLKLAENESLNISQPGDYLDRSQYQVSFDGDGTASDLVIIRILPKNQS